MMALANQYRAEVEFERFEHEAAATELIARTEEHAAHIRAKAESEQVEHETAATELIARAEKRAAHIRASADCERVEQEAAATELIARTQEHAAHIRAEAEAYAAATRRSANEYAVERRTEVEQLRNSLIAADELLANAEAEAKTRRDEILSEAEARLSSLVDAQLDARINLAKVVNGIDTALSHTALDPNSAAPRPDAAANS